MCVLKIRSMNRRKYNFEVWHVGGFVAKIPAEAEGGKSDDLRPKHSPDTKEVFNLAP
jgi:hypothetical protein